MNKTRMGKRVASLLLSLVMMLSLLPTAAYATMADDVDTQGASVSENGTGVSDDDNSSGDTGDQQVVGGSSVSGTADDTTGAEGDADTIGAEGGNDSTSVTPSNRVEVNGTVYDTLDEAIAAAEPVNGVITYEIYGKVEANSTESWIEVLKAGLTDVTKVAFVGMTNDAEISITNSTSVLADQNYDIDVSFVDLTLSHSNGAWVGDLGHATEYFTCVLRNTDAANNTVTYTNCTFPNGVCNNQYGKTVFDNCKFTNATSGKYNLWNYGGTTEITNSDFTGTRGIKTYNEGTLAESPEVAVKDTTFTGLTEKAAIVASKPTDIKLDSISTTECSKGVFQKDIEGSTDAEKVTIEANGSGISGNFNVTAEKAAEAAKGEFNITAGSFTAQVPGDYCAEGFTIEKNTDGSYGVKEDQPSANVAKVGGTEYATLEAAIAALSSSSYTLELLDGSAWDAATPVYWAAGTQSGYVATLAEALTAAYKASGNAITIVCRPGADVGKLTHGHVADNITIYGNNAYISSGECELEVDTFMYSRETGKQVTTGGAYLDKDITVTAYELDNLGVWGERHTDHKVTVNLTDCDSVKGITAQRVYISGTTGVNDITLTGCDFGTKATSVYSNADGAVVIDNCSFTGAQVPVNFNHKAGGTQTVTVRNSKFNNCGDNGDWKQFAAPVRFVNSGSGTMTTTVDTCTFNGTVGGNGDILLGDGRVGQSSNDVKLNVANTEATVQAQQPGYYGNDGTKDASKQGTKTVAAGDTLATSVNELVSGETYVAAVGEKKYDSLQAAIDAAKSGATVTLLADTYANVTIAKAMTLDLNGHTLNGGQVKAKPALTVSNSSVTIQDSSAAQTGTIMREDTAENSGVSSHYVIDIQGKYGFLKFEGGNVKNNSGTTSGKGASLIRLGNDNNMSANPTLTIKGGTFTQDNFIAIKVDRGTLHLLGGTVNSANSFAIENWNNAYIKGGTVNGTVSTWVYSTGAAFSKLEISGGTVNGNVASVNYDNAADKQARVYVTGGTVTGTLGTYTYNNGLVAMDETAKATIEVTGGTFKEDPTQYVVEGSAISKNDDGTFGVAKAYLAMVGDTSYYTMDEAFHAAVASGETLTLLRDYTTGSSQNSGSKSFTIDLNGFTWTYTGKDVDCAAFEINYSDVTLTVKNGKVVSSQLAGLIPSAMSGTITYNNSGLVFDGVEMTANGHSGIETNGSNTNDTVTLKNSTLNVPNGYGIYFPSSGTLTIENSKINAKTMGVQVCAGSLNVTGADTAITVSGDGIEKTGNDGAIEDGAAISIVERTGYKGLTAIKVEGGTFTANGTNAAVKAYKWENQTASAFDNSKNVVAVSGGTFSSAVDKSLCADGFIPTQNSDGTYGVKEGKYVAEIGSQGYETLQAAVDAAEDDQTVTLLADATEDVAISKSITLDLGGKTLTNTNASKATISVTGGTVTVKNGNVKGGTGYYNIEAKKDANLTLTDVTATAGNTGSSMIDNWGTLTITSGTYTGGMNTVKSEEGSKLTITGGTFTCDFGQNYKYTAVILVYGTTTITGGEFIQKTTNTSSHAQVVATGVEEGYSAITTITGGKFTNEKLSGIFHGLGKATSDNFEVSGGTFNRYVSDSYMAEGLIPVKQSDGTYGVKEGKFVAEVGSIGYETLDEAIAAANASANSKTVYLRENITVDHQLVINNAKGKTITLDLQKHILTSTYAINAANKNGSYALVNQTTLTVKNGTFAAGQARAIGALAALTLNGATVTQQLTGGHACVAFCADGKSYTIKNSTIEGAYAVCSFANNATITITGSTLTGTGNTLYHNGSNYGLKLTVKDTTITSSGSCGVYISGSTSAQSNADNQNGAGKYQQATFTGCTISGAMNGVEVKYTDLTLDGCTVSATAKDASYKQDNNGPAGSGFAVVSTDNAMNNATPKPEGTIIIKGTGKYTGPVGLGSLKSVKETYADFADETIKISGGTFTTEIPAAYCADGFIPTQNEDGTYGVKVGQYVAEVGSTKYETLAEAVAAAQDGQTVTLLADAEQNTQLSVDKSITLDLNGKTIKNTEDIWGDNTNAILSITKGAKVTITGNGTIAAKENDCYTINVVNGDLTIENGTFVGNISVVQVQKGSLTINGGAFSLLQKMTDGKGENRYLINCIDDTYADGSATVAISGGTFVGFDPNVSPEQPVDGKAPSFAAPGAGITKNEDGSFTAAAGMTAQILDKDGNSVKAYKSLADAVAAAEDGQTVRLLADAAEDVVINKSITLDLGGKTLTNTNANKATISVTSGTVTVKNGNVVGGTGYYNIEVKKDANLTLTDVTATAGNNGSSMIDNYGTLTITSGTYTGGLDTVKNEPNAKLNISGGTFTLTKGNSDGFTGVVFNYGELTISGGEFIQSDKNAPYGQAQVIHTDKSGSAAPSTVITGGTFKNLCTRTTAWVVREMNAAAGATKVSGGAFNKEVKDYYCADGFIPTKNADGTYGVKVGKYVAEIGSKKYETLADAIRLAAKGKTITLLADVEQNTQLTINKSITLDLNGKTIKISGYTAEKAQVSVKGNLTIQDSSEAQTGKICSDYTGTAGRVVSVEDGGKLTIAGGTITTEGMSGPSGSAVYIASGAEVNMTGGTVKVDAKRGNVAMNVKGSTGVFIMSGGSVIAEAGDGTETNITAISGSSGSTIQISAGTVSGPQAVFARSSATTITGGNFTGSITVKNGSISGGTFDRALDKKACAAGYVPADNGNGTYGVEIGKFTVKVTSRTTGSDSPVANVAGGGSDITYAEGTTVTASAISGYNFVGWFVNEYTGTPYSTDLTCEVKPTDDCTMIAVYEPISGGVFALEVSASKFTVNGGATQRSYLLEKMPVGTQVTVVFKGSENFLYWVNESGKVVSTSKTYTFPMGSATTLKAVYAEKEENQAMVVFISHTQQVISSKGYTDTQEIKFPEPPIKMGATFVRWSMTEAEIRAAMATTATGIIVVEPVYEFNAGSYTVTVNYPNGETAAYTATVGKITTVTAKSIDGKVFKCWKNGDTVLGYTETLKIAPRGDLTLTAEYVDAGTTVDRLPVIALTEISASQQGAKYAVSFTATRSVPDGYTVTEQGVLVSTNSRYGEAGALDAMKLDADGVNPDDTKILKATNTDAAGVTVLNGIVTAADRTVYGRAYMILRDSSGTMVYVYSDTILSGSYNSLTTNGGN